MSDVDASDRVLAHREGGWRVVEDAIYRQNSVTWVWTIRTRLKRRRLGLCGMLSSRGHSGRQVSISLPPSADSSLSLPGMSLRKAVLQRITPLPSRTPSPNIPPDWPQSPVEPEPELIAHHIAPDEHLASTSRSKTP